MKSWGKGCIEGGGPSRQGLNPEERSLDQLLRNPKGLRGEWEIALSPIGKGPSRKNSRRVSCEREGEKNFSHAILSPSIYRISANIQSASI